MSKKPNFKKLGEEAKSCRLGKDLPQEKFAEEVGLSVRTIIRVEQGQAIGDLARTKIEKYIASEGKSV